MKKLQIQEIFKGAPPGFYGFHCKDWFYQTRWGRVFAGVEAITGSRKYLQR